jgi:hypothetical protein
MLPVGRAEDLPFVGPRGAQDSFEVKAGDHVLHRSIAIVALNGRVEDLKARRKDDRPHLHFKLLWLLEKIDRVLFANPGANRTFPFPEEKATFGVYISDKRNGLGKIDMDGLAQREALIVWILNLDRTVVDTGRATRAFALDDISGLLDEGDTEVSSVSFHPVDFGVAQDFYVRIPADLDQFGREDSHGAVIGRKGLVKLGHMAAEGRRLVHQVDLKPGSGKIKRGLNAADPSSDDHHVSRIARYETLASLFLDSLEVLSHVSSPHRVSSSPKWLPEEPL